MRRIGEDGWTDARELANADVVKIRSRVKLRQKPSQDGCRGVSRHVEKRELESASCSLPQHGEKVKELLLQLFNLANPETAAPRTADRWIILRRYWIRLRRQWRDCYFRPDDASSPVDGIMLSDCLWVIGTQCSPVQVI